MLRAALLALLAAACVPHPGGQCNSDGDCGYGTTCQVGLCSLAPNGRLQVPRIIPNTSSGAVVNPQAARRQGQLQGSGVNPQAARRRAATGSGR